MNKALNRLLAPRLQRALAETSGKTLDARKADAADFVRITVEHNSACFRENSTDVFLFAGLELMVSEHPHNGELQTLQLLGQDGRFFRHSLINWIATQQEYV